MKRFFYALLPVSIALFSGCQPAAPTPPPSAALTEKVWVVTGITDNAMTLSGKSFVRFHNGQNSEVEGFAGCNRFGGAYVISGKTITIGPLRATRMFCPAMQEEQAVMGALHSADSYSVSEGELLLLHNERIILRLHSAPAQP